jgi:hypothetical protein
MTGKRLTYMALIGVSEDRWMEGHQSAMDAENDGSGITP